MRSKPGAYAMLLGSGISSAAGIPTGWGVVIELIKKLAAAEGHDCGDRPEEWYKSAFGSPPSYSELLEKLFKTETDRQQYLKRLFEPTPEEREQGKKLPTNAHHVIAELMEKGLVKVVVTTNFDRLLEQALASRGVPHVVIDSPSKAKGMMPLRFERSCIIKVHGDYLDPQILNIEKELGSFDPATLNLIKQVFDDYGVVVCGWSATYDTALREAINGTVDRRFSWYWTRRDPLEKAAQSVVDDRKASLIDIESADKFFADLMSRIHGLEEFDRPHPLDVAAAVGAAKRYVGDNSKRVQLYDLYHDALTDALTNWFDRPPQEPVILSPQTMCDRIKAYDASAETIVSLTATVGRWTSGEFDSFLLDAVSESVRNEPYHFDTPHQSWEPVCEYPARLLYYTTGMVSLLTNRPSLFSELMLTPTPSERNLDSVAAVRFRFALNPYPAMFSPLFGGVGKAVPLSTWMYTKLREPFRSLVRSDEHYELLFDTFEFYHAILYRALHPSNLAGMPSGKWCVVQQDREAMIQSLEHQRLRYGGRAFVQECMKNMGKTWNLEFLLEGIQNICAQMNF
ncbi:SIR2 family protein [Sorlinia euscelidii]